MTRQRRLGISCDWPKCMRTLWGPADVETMLELENYARTFGWTGSSPRRRGKNVSQEHRCPLHAGWYLGVRTGRPANSLRKTG